MLRTLPASVSCQRKLQGMSVHVALQEEVEQLLAVRWKPVQSFSQSGVTKYPLPHSPNSYTLGLNEFVSIGTLVCIKHKWSCADWLWGSFQMLWVMQGAVHDCERIRFTENLTGKLLVMVSVMNMEWLNVALCVAVGLLSQGAVGISGAGGGKDKAMNQFLHKPQA